MHLVNEDLAKLNSNVLTGTLILMQLKITRDFNVSNSFKIT